jgi:hypothetical protein
MALPGVLPRIDLVAIKKLYPIRNVKTGKSWQRKIPRKMSGLLLARSKFDGRPAPQEPPENKRVQGSPLPAGGSHFAVGKMEIESRSNGPETTR